MNAGTSLNKGATFQAGFSGYGMPSRANEFTPIDAQFIWCTLSCEIIDKFLM